MKTKRFYGKGLPNVDPTKLQGTLIVLEGSDGSGRSKIGRASCRERV